MAEFALEATKRERQNDIFRCKQNTLVIWTWQLWWAEIFQSRQFCVTVDWRYRCDFERRVPQAAQTGHLWWAYCVNKDLEVWCQDRLDIRNPDSTAVIKQYLQANVEDEPGIQIILSSPRLLSLAAKVIIGSTYKLNLLGFHDLIIATTDSNKVTGPLALGLS